jgi:hypothetical protein
MSASFRFRGLVVPPSQLAELLAGKPHRRDSRPRDGRGPRPALDPSIPGIPPVTLGLHLCRAHRLFRQFEQLTVKGRGPMPQFYDAIRCHVVLLVGEVRSERKPTSICIRSASSSCSIPLTSGRPQPVPCQCHDQVSGFRSYAKVGHAAGGPRDCPARFVPSRSRR